MNKSLTEIITAEAAMPVTFSPPEVHKLAELTTPKADHLAVIARAIAALTWVDAEQMGEAIASHHDAQKSLTSAIQAWAATQAKNGA